MSQFKAEVVKFELSKHPDADKLSIATIRGWQCVVNTDGIKNDTLAVYIPIDAFTDKDHPLLGFLEGKKVKTKKLRGVISQGVLLPLSEVEKHFNRTFKEGDDLTKLLNLKKYVAPEDTDSTNESHATTERPTSLPKYTDIENWKNYPNIIKLGEEVVISEKLHGCLISNSKISLPDGSTKTIKELVETNYRGYVLGYDGTKVVNTKVLNTFNNGITEDWLNIEIYKTKTGSGSSLSCIKCTPNHKIFNLSTNKYVKASELKVGDKTLVTRYSWDLNSLQKQILIGKMLGDGSLCLRKNKTSSCITFGHKKEHEKYIDWTLAGLGSIAGNKQKEVISGYGTLMCKGKTIDCFQITEYFKNWNINTEKQFPESFINEVGPIALAFWYMDDGSLAHNEGQEDRANFATCSFSERSILNLCKVFEKFNIKATPIYRESYKGSKKYWRITLNCDEADKFFLLVAPYIPKVMRYKLPERYRNGTPWLPSYKSEYKKIITEGIIRKINKLKLTRSINKTKYDLETETHNFFCNGVLVHNSNASFALLDGKFYITSRNLVLRTEPKIIKYPLFSNEKLNLFLKKLRLLKYFSRNEVLPVPQTKWHLGAKCTGMYEKVSRISKLIGDRDVVVFGELLNTQKNFNYGLETNQYIIRAFDIYIPGHGYINYDDFKYLCNHADLITVPILKEGPLEEKDFNLRKGNSLELDASHIREGIVIKPKMERQDRSLGRVILKVISEDYLMR